VCLSREHANGEVAVFVGALHAAAGMCVNLV